METYFNDVVDKAIEDLYYCCDNDKAKAAVDALLLAAKDGDGDACYVLSRCFPAPVIAGNTIRLRKMKQPPMLCFIRRSL